MITCPRCLRTSHNPNDIKQGYCGACHDWTQPMSDYFNEVAEMLASSRTVGPYADRATILSTLRARFASEEALRAFMAEQWARAQRVLSDPNTVGLLVPPKPGETQWELLRADPNAKDH